MQHLDRLNYTLCESGSQVYIHKESGSQTVSGRVSCSRSVAHQTCQAEDFKLLGHPTVQRGEFYRLKFVGLCVGWLRRVFTPEGAPKMISMELGEHPLLLP